MLGFLLIRLPLSYATEQAHILFNSSVRSLSLVGPATSDAGGSGNRSVSGGISELTANCTAHTDLIYYIAVPLLVILPPLIGLLITVIESWSSGAQWTDRFDPDYWLKRIHEAAEKAARRETGCEDSCLGDDDLSTTFGSGTDNSSEPAIYRRRTVVQPPPDDPYGLLKMVAANMAGATRATMGDQPSTPSERRQRVSLNMPDPKPLPFLPTSRRGQARSLPSAGWAAVRNKPRDPLTPVNATDTEDGTASH